MKETESVRKKWKDILCSQIGKINIFKIHTLPKQSTESIHEIFQRTITNNPKIYMQPQETSNSHSSLEKNKKKQSWRYHTPWLQTILQSYSNQMSMNLAQK